MSWSRYIKVPRKELDLINWYGRFCLEDLEVYLVEGLSLIILWKEDTKK